MLAWLSSGKDGLGTGASRVGGVWRAGGKSGKWVLSDVLRRRGGRINSGHGT